MPMVLSPITRAPADSACHLLCQCSRGVQPVL